MEKTGKYAKFVDLHTHSVFSTGSDTPSQLVKKAKKINLAAIALTDHNTLDGLREFSGAAGKAGLLFLYGAEIWVKADNGDSHDLVILGKEITSKARKAFGDYQSIIPRERIRTVKEVVEKISKMGFDVSGITEKNIIEDVKAAGYSHYTVLLRNLILNVEKNKKILAEISCKKKPTFFEVVKYLYGTGCPAHVARMKSFTRKDAKDLAKRMDWKIFLAHPGGISGFISDEELQPYIKEKFGIEVYTYFNSEKQTSYLLDLCKKHNLPVTGGSDYHGKHYGIRLGMGGKPGNGVPYRIFENILKSF